MSIEIRHANIQDKENILKFIKEHWNSNHIFVNDPSLFDYYHVKDGNLTFVIAEDKNTNEILGIQGYILSNDNESPDVWGVIWKVAPNPVPLLGISIMKYIREVTHCRIFAGVGANPNTTLKLIRGLKEYTGKLNHYYRLADLEHYTIATIRKKKIPSLNVVEESDLILINNQEELRLHFDRNLSYEKPFKSNDYIINRYFEHPTHKYMVYGIKKKNNEKYNSIIVIREQEYQNSAVLRIIDFIGNSEDLRTIGMKLQQILETKKYEYIDFYCKGIDPKILLEMGFLLREEDDVNIIPNYFEPFLSKNIEIYYNTTDDEQFYVFKGDGDQDRPNMFK